jgi:hypothetical protein
MNIFKNITVLVLASGLMGLLGLIVVDEFMMANAHGGNRHRRNRGRVYVWQWF